MPQPRSGRLPAEVDSLQLQKEAEQTEPVQANEDGEQLTQEPVKKTANDDLIADILTKHFVVPNDLLAILEKEVELFKPSNPAFSPAPPMTYTPSMVLDLVKPQKDDTQNRRASMDIDPEVTATSSAPMFLPPFDLVERIKKAYTFAERSHPVEPIGMLKKIWNEDTVPPTPS